MINWEEHWIPAKGYKGLYEVSSLGRVRSLDRVINLVGGRKSFLSGRVLRCAETPKGYINCALYKNKTCYTKKVHRIVAMSFYCNGHSKHVNHIDGDKKNNRIENLEFVTCKENIRHSKENGLSKYAFGEANGQSKLTTENVREIRLMIRDKIKTGAIAKKFGVTRATIGAIRRGKTWSHV